MNDKNNLNGNHCDPGEERSAAFLERLVRYHDGDLSDLEVAALEQELQSSRAKRIALIDYQLQSTRLVEVLQRDAYEVNESCGTAIFRREWTWNRLSYCLGVLALCLVVIIWGGRLLVESSRQSYQSIRLTGSARAQFLGESQPSLNSQLEHLRDYKLLHGMIELSFPTGATAIIEGPSLFRVADRDVLVLDVGKCSVHAPDGAQGFVVETPLNRIVDRGTRFTVNVGDTMETTVQVIEGAADIYSKSSPLDNSETAPQASGELRLTEREAIHIGESGARASATIPYSQELYREQLPDRVISIQSKPGPMGGAEYLDSVTVASNGRERTYGSKELIPCTLMWFKSVEVSRFGHLACPAHGEIDITKVLGDMRLNSGITNPGGSRGRLSASPRMDGSAESTPGFAVRFQEPVRNRSGIDVIFFELQSITNPTKGDGFHVSPVRFTQGSRSHTILSYDIQYDSSQSPRLEPFALRRFESPVETLEALSGESLLRPGLRQGFQVLAVGIDLSDLGFNVGEMTTELFFQDALDDEEDHYVDPVLILGLP